MQPARWPGGSGFIESRPSRPPPSDTLSLMAQSMGITQRNARIAAERQSGREMAASRDARNAGDLISARAYKRAAMATIRKAHPLKGDKN